MSTETRFWDFLDDKARQCFSANECVPALVETNPADRASVGQILELRVSFSFREASRQTTKGDTVDETSTFVASR